jgi:hypothetical protein
VLPYVSSALRGFPMIVCPGLLAKSSNPGIPPIFDQSAKIIFSAMNITTWVVVV